MRALSVAIAIVISAVRLAAADVPWAEGVPVETQRKANAIFADGNQLFAQQAHAAAIEKYQEAVALWDHPLIRFNLAVTMIRLDRILEADHELERALRYGGKPFSAELFQQAQDYQRLVAGRVGTVEASCTQPGGEVLLDGKPWFACPGKQHVRVLTGEHIVVGEKAAYLTLSRRLLVTGGGTSTAELTFTPIDTTVRYEYPTKRWIPWTVASTGAAIGIGGLAIYLSGQSQLDQFADDYRVECPDGCPSDLSTVPDLERDYDAAMRKGRIGVGMMIGGGAIAVGGVLWNLVGNRPRRVLPAVEVVPTNGGATAHAGWRF